MNCASCVRVSKSLEISVFIWNDLVLLQEVPKSLSRIIFDKFSGFFQLVYFRPNFYFYWPILLSESIHLKCFSVA